MSEDQRRAVIVAARAFVKHDSPATYSRLLRAVQILDGEDVAPEPASWVELTWADVQKGDKVRLAGMERTIKRRIDTDPGKPKFSFEGFIEYYSMPGINSVEILLDQKDLRRI